MELEATEPTVSVFPELKQVIGGFVHVHSQHSWRVDNDTGAKQQIRIRCVLRDNLGNQAVGFDDTASYNHREYVGCRELRAVVETGYNSAQTVTWTAETIVQALDVVLPLEVNSKSNAIDIVEPSPLAPQPLSLRPAARTHALRNMVDAIRRTERFAPSASETRTFLQHRYQMLGESLFTLGRFPAARGDGKRVVLKSGTLDFTDSTAIHYYILAPRVLGGTSSDVLFLTSSNRASKGCEALVSYEGGREAVFRIWDWATPPDADDERWVFCLGHKDWGDYELDYPLVGISHKALYVENTTRKLVEGWWANEVSLLNKVTDSLDMVWRFEFPWSPSGNKHFDWGPFIETSAADYGETNYVGFAETRMVQDNATWPLTKLNSQITDDCSSFQILYLEPNSTFFAR